MPPSRSVFKRCTCEQCIEQGDHDENGTPKGLLVLERLMAPHVQRVRAERAALACAADSGRSHDGVNLVASRLSTLNIADTLSVSVVPDNRGRFTASRELPDILTSADLLVHAELPKTAPPVSVPALTDEFERLALLDSFHAMPSQEQRDMTASCRGVFQRDNSRQTIKASKLLDNIESRVQRCFRLLSVGGSGFDDVGHELPLLRKAAGNVRGRAETVTSQKDAILSQIDLLKAQFDDRKPIATASQKPVEFDTGKSDHHDLCSCAHHFTDVITESRVNRSDEIAQVAEFLCVACNVFMGVSRRGCDFILGIISILLFLAFRRPDGTLNFSHEHILKQIPMTVERALTNFHLTGKTVKYAVCRCHCTYAPTYTDASTVPVYPERCTHCPTPGVECGEPLLEPGPDGMPRPKKTFTYHDFKDYLAGLLSRADIEAVMDQACNDLQDTINSPHPPLVHNVFEAQFLREFGGPEPASLFIDRGEEGRYAFALHVDFFNPEGMNLRGASTSCGIISMACLNLPLDLRYKPENMYIAGIIPGPKQPSLENLNHYIRPLIDDMVDAWERGIKFSGTAGYATGRLTRSAVALAVCDLPAARHLASLAGTGSHFYCSACNCYHKSTYSRVDFESWEIRDKDRLREYAERWRDAETLVEREKLFKAHGVRYSEMWRLPYWDPSRQLVVDPMHCILEGLVQHHTRSLLGLTTETRASTSNPPAFSCELGAVPGTMTMTTKEMTQVFAIRTLLVSQVPTTSNNDLDTDLDKLKISLSRKNSQPLKFVCAAVECTPQKASRLLKMDYVKALVEWVSFSMCLLQSNS